jgi:AcrR family transcriptional regulator
MQPHGGECRSAYDALMGRPREFDRAEALRTAMHLFWERGYERTSIAQLKDAMGISAPSFYAAFTDKQTLFEEAVADYEQGPTAVASRALAQSTARQVFDTMLDLAVEGYSSSDHPHGCLVMSDPACGVQRQLLRKAIAQRLRNAISEGDLPESADPKALADFIVVVLGGLSARARDGASRKELRAAADMARRAWPEPASTTLRPRRASKARSAKPTGRKHLSPSAPNEFE